MKANPNIEFGIMSNGATIRIRGKVVFEEDPDIVREFLDENPGYKDLYKENIDKLKLIYIEHGKISIFTITELFKKTNYYAFNL